MAVLSGAVTTILQLLLGSVEAGLLEKPVAHARGQRAVPQGVAFLGAGPVMSVVGINSVKAVVITAGLLFLSAHYLTTVS